MQDRLSEQIAALPSLNKAQLLAIWAENFSQDAPPNLRKELMVPILAYRMQEKEIQAAYPIRPDVDSRKLQLL